jgi:hypothetical protein
MNAIILARAGDISQRGRRFLAELAKGIHEHRFLHAFALLALATGAVVGNVTRVHPDIDTLESFGSNLADVFLLAGGVGALGALAWLLVVRKSRSPARDGLRLLGDQAWLARAMSALVVITVFAIAFGTLKGAIAVLVPFTWDKTFADAGRILSFGHQTYEWFWPVLRNPLAVMVLNVLYNLWFVLVLASFLGVVVIRREGLRHRYLMAFMVVWFVGGFLLAMAFSSAGPCYYARLQLGHQYDALMAALAAANQHYPIWALSTQNTLWQGFTGERPGSVGITAFPSMHVATAVLMALFAGSVNRVLGWVMWVYAGLIMASSVILGWHYAVDGYAAVALSLVSWKLAGIYAKRQVPTAS